MITTAALITAALGATIYDQAPLTAARPWLAPTTNVVMYAQGAGVGGATLRSEPGILEGTAVLDRLEIRNTDYVARTTIEGSAESIIPFEIYVPEIIGFREYTLGFSISAPTDLTTTWKDPGTWSLTPQGDSLMIWKASGVDYSDGSGTAFSVDWWIQGETERVEGSADIPWSNLYGFAHAFAYSTTSLKLFNSFLGQHETVSLFRGELDGGQLDVGINASTRINIVPEPSAIALLAIGLVLLPMHLRRGPTAKAIR